MARARWSMNIPKNLKTRVRKAAILSGHKNLTEYVVSVINEKPTAVDEWELSWLTTEQIKALLNEVLTFIRASPK